MGKLASGWIMGMGGMVLAVSLMCASIQNAFARPGEFFGFSIGMTTDQSKGMAESLAKRLQATVKTAPDGVAIVKGGNELMAIRHGRQGIVHTIILKPGIFGVKTIDMDTFEKFRKANAFKDAPITETMLDGDVYSVANQKFRVKARYYPAGKERNEIVITRLF